MAESRMGCFREVFEELFECDRVGASLKLGELQTMRGHRRKRIFLFNEQGRRGRREEEEDDGDGVQEVGWTSLTEGGSDLGGGVQVQ
jgi:hypothetical protein